MSQISKELAIARKSLVFDEVYELSRTFMLALKNHEIVKVMLYRYYTESGCVNYRSEYTKRDINGVWKDVNYPAIISGSNDEETSIKMAIHFIKEANELN